jgi:hypothetical protein
VEQAQLSSPGRLSLVNAIPVAHPRWRVSVLRRAGPPWRTSSTAGVDPAVVRLV